MIPLIIALSIAVIALYAIAAKRGKKIKILEAGLESAEQIRVAQLKDIIKQDRKIDMLTEEAIQDEKYITAHRRVIDARDQEIEILKLKLLQQKTIATVSLIGTAASFFQNCNDSKKKPLPKNIKRKKPKPWTPLQKKEFIAGFSSKKTKNF